MEIPISAKESGICGDSPFAGKNSDESILHISKNINTYKKLALQFFWGKLGLSRPAVPLPPLWVSP